MMATARPPSQILASCRVKGSLQTEEESEKALIELLGQIQFLVPNDNSDIVSILGSALWNDAGTSSDSGADDGSTPWNGAGSDSGADANTLMTAFSSDKNGDEWKASMELIQLILGRTGSSCISNQRHQHGNLAPHVILRIAIDSSLDLADVDNDADNDADTIFSIKFIFVLIAFSAVRLQTCDIWTYLKQEKKIRWRRATSMTMECIGLYQRLILSALLKPHIRRTNSTLQSAVTLHCQFLAPIIVGSLAALRSRGKVDQRKVQIVEAGLLSSALDLSRVLNTASDLCSSDSQNLSLNIIRSSILTLDALDVVLIHPLRLHYYKKQHSVDESDEDDEDSNNGFCLVERTDIDDFTAMVSRPVGSSESACGMKTYFDDLGVAFVAFHLVNHRFEEQGRNILSHALSPKYLFSLIYPHVGTILLLGQSEDTHMAFRTKQLKNGIRMLENILDATRANCEETSSLFSGIDEDAWFGPLGPIANVQLLLNEATALSDQVGSATGDLVGIGRCDVSKSRILGIIRQLLARYPALQHIECIEYLLSRCPYPCLEPVLLDFLRPALLKTSDGREHEGEVEMTTMGVLRTYIRKMSAHIQNGGEYRGTSAGDLLYIDDLMETVEQYVCTASLIRLLCIRRSQYENGARATSELANAVALISDFHRRLLIFLDEEAKRQNSVGGEMADANYFQLHLLLDALGEAKRTASSNSCF